jgi:Ca2+-binding EF-hand superfamily protein
MGKVKEKFIEIMDKIIFNEDFNEEDFNALKMFDSDDDEVIKFNVVKNEV